MTDPKPPTVAEVKAAGYSDDAAAKIAADEKAKADAKADAKPAKRGGSIFAVQAHWNDDRRHPAASFHAQSDAEGFADAYGGTVAASGVAFVVTDADHERALNDAEKATS